MKILIKNGRVIDPDSGFDELCNVAISQGKIIQVGSTPDGFEADKTIDATGQWVFPGIVDLCARLREPGLEQKATIASETRAAARAGITTLCCPPDTSPIIENSSVVEMINHLSEESNQARVVMIGAMTQSLAGNQISEMMSLKAAGVVGVGNAMEPVKNTLVMRRAMEYAAGIDIPVFLFAEDPWLKGSACAHEGAISTRMGLGGIPEIAETIAVARELALIEQTGVRAHFCRLSTAKAARMIARAKYDGLSVSADVSAHQLHLTDMDLGEFDAMYHVRPPFRTLRDRDGLRRGLMDETITAICSDHQPHDEDAKIGPFSTTEPGISALETLLPLSMRLVQEKTISIQRVLAALTSEPAKVLGINTGKLQVDAIADVCVYDPQRSWMLTKDSLESAGQNTPFLGWEFEGQVTTTIYQGSIVHELENQ